MSNKTLKNTNQEKDTITLSSQQMMNLYTNEKGKLQVVERRFETLQNLLNETLLTINSLQEMKKTPKNEKIMVSLGAGVYADATINENEKVKVSMGGNVILETKIEKAIKDLEKRQKDLETDIEATVKEQEISINKINRLGNIINTAQNAIKQKNK